MTVPRPNLTSLHRGWRYPKKEVSVVLNFTSTRQRHRTKKAGGSSFAARSIGCRCRRWRRVTEVLPEEETKPRVFFRGCRVGLKPRYRGTRGRRISVLCIDLKCVRSVGWNVYPAETEKYWANYRCRMCHWYDYAEAGARRQFAGRASTGSDRSQCHHMWQNLTFQNIIHPGRKLPWATTF